MRRFSSRSAREGEAGFSLLEIMVSLAIFSMIVAAGYAMLHDLQVEIAKTYDSPGGPASMEELSALMSDSADSSFAIFVPSKDVHGGNNSDGHEVDFYAQNGGTNIGITAPSFGPANIFWAYVYDSAAHAVQRFDYDRDNSGNITALGVRDPQTGVVNPSVTPSRHIDISGFAAHTLDAADLTGPHSLLGSAFANLPTAPSLPVGFDQPNGLYDPEVVGGNRGVEVTIGGTNTASSVVHLFPGTLATGFDIDKFGPQARVILYSQSIRQIGPLGSWGKVYRDYYARVTTSYDNWASETSWCSEIPLGQEMVESWVLGRHYYDHTDGPSDFSASAIIDACYKKSPPPTPAPPFAPADASDPSGNPTMLSVDGNPSFPPSPVPSP
ncbi:MAG TPA: prepilin-type N-terminal cleavage/methylation domain-containing protein [Candidatus Baltobacteraceae bacterium]|nr:prepilin-type N-terminal cleavage/methylation domain-containing protein [Candidatus Baltobacteraceae bacterium]